MEQTLREEIMEMARQAAITALRNPTIPHAAKIQFFNSAKDEAQTVIPVGKLEETKKKLSEVAAVPGPHTKLRTRSDLAAQAAAVALQKKRSSPIPDEEGPSSVKLEIIDEGAELNEDIYLEKK
jgi:hypothetical protein